LANIDAGRPVKHFSTSLVDVDLSAYGEMVLDDLVIREVEVNSENGQVYVMKLGPYRTINNVIDGVVITFEDVTIRKKAEKVAGERQNFLTAVLDCSANGIVACDKDGLLSYFNQPTRELLGLPLVPFPPEEWGNYYSMYEVDGKTPIKSDDNPLNCALSDRGVVDRQCVVEAKGLPARTISVTSQEVFDLVGNKIGAVSSMIELTEPCKKGNRSPG
jgi:PAS domain-containing protein